MVIIGAKALETLTQISSLGLSFHEQTRDYHLFWTRNFTDDVEDECEMQEST
jgi:hypothetical protein